MQVTGMLYGAKLLQFAGFPTSEVLGPDASEEEIKAPSSNPIRPLKCDRRANTRAAIRFQCTSGALCRPLRVATRRARLCFPAAAGRSCRRCSAAGRRRGRKARETHN